MTPGNPAKISKVVISTALGHDGRGIFPYTLWPGYRKLIRAARETGTTIFSKSSTRFKRIGNFIPWNPLTWRYIRRLPEGGMLNAYGLTNAGVEACARDLRTSGEQGLQVIPNFYPEFAKGTEIAIRETLEAIDILAKSLGPLFWALELNFSCPNSQEAIAQNVAQGLACVRKIKESRPTLFLIAKISRVHPYEFAQELERAGVNAIHGVNTIPYELIYPPDRYPRSPLWQVNGGGVSGGPAFAEAYAYNAVLRQKVNLFVIMGCGVRSKEDVQRYLDLGADALSFCTLALRDPGAAEKIILAYNRVTPSSY
ncbi:MAG: HisA/HisF-related TIM barrel protein [Thermodesulfobacteriota bacterium]